MRTTSLLLLAALLCVPAPAQADDAARIEFVEQRFAEGQTGASVWYWLFGGGAVAYTGALATVAVITDDRDTRIQTAAGAFKGAAFAAITLLVPMPARTAGDELAALPADTDEQRSAKAARAEELLRAAKMRADKRMTWLPHTLNVALNTIVGAVLVCGFDQSVLRTTLSSVAGVVAVEVAHFTYPSRAQDDLVEYESRFSVAPGAAGELPGIAWTLRF